jgi:hypothetical protein
LRAQIIVALVVVLILIAVPLYLWRRPNGDDSESVSSATPPAASASAPTSVTDPAHERVKLAPAQRVRCSASPTTSGQEGQLCDSLPFFEDALAKAIRENVGCAPRADADGTINYVLTVDFDNRRLHVYPGRSGTWKGPQARRAATCIKKQLATPDWPSIKHQYRYYMIAILATYPAHKEEAPPGPDGAPIFE